MEIIIAVIIAVSGWLINHILTIRAQNKSFINHIINDARLKITRAIGDYQDWLSKIHVVIITSDSDIILQKRGININWLQKVDELIKLFYTEAPLKWIFLLEEYEILFPKTAECRKALLNRHKQIREYLDSFLRDFQDSLARLSILGQLKKVIERAQKDVGIVVDQSALMQDLLIYFQNTCLSSFTGNKIPERKPEDLSLPRLVQDKKGILRISVCPNKNSN